MAEKTTLREHLFCAFLYIIFLTGAVFQYKGIASGIFTDMTPYILLLTGTLTLIFSNILRTGKAVFLFTVMYLLLFIIEYIGVQSGEIFGQYKYGEVLGCKIGDVPVIIGFNWLMIIISAYSISLLLFRNKILIMLMASLLSVFLDLLIEPAAMKLGYWQWVSAHVPFQNYAAWFAITFASGLVINRADFRFGSIIYLHYYASLFIFFLIINLK